MQHRGLLDQVLEFFGIEPEFDLNLMQANQDLFHITSSCLTGMKKVLDSAKPDVVLVQGDTSTTFAAALAAFYCRIPVGHVEAGLRTGEKVLTRFPEEMNRRMTSSSFGLSLRPDIGFGGEPAQGKLPRFADLQHGQYEHRRAPVGQ